MGFVLWGHLGIVLRIVVSTRLFIFFFFFFFSFFLSFSNSFLLSLVSIKKYSSDTDYANCNIFRCTYKDEVISDIVWTGVTIGRHCIILYFENVTFVDFDFTNVVFTAQQEVFFPLFFFFFFVQLLILYFLQIIFRDTTFKNNSGMNDDATLTLTPDYVPPTQKAFITFDGLNIGM